MKRIIVVAHGVKEGSWRWFCSKLPTSEYRWDFIFVQQTVASRIYSGIKTLLLVLFSDHKSSIIVASHDPKNSMWVSFCLSLCNLKIRHIAFSFNFVSLPKKTKTKIYSHFYKNIEAFEVFSKYEKELYKDYFDIPESKLKFRHWAVDVPEVDPESPIIDGDYICSIGGNGRDYETLIKVCHKRPDIPVVLVVRPETLEGLMVPDHVKVFVNLEKSKTMNIINYSKFVVLPLIDEKTPCGHVTIVASMHLKKPVIATLSNGITDYIKDGENGILIPHLDVELLERSIESLWFDQNKQICLGSKAKKFSEEFCSEKIAIDYFLDRINSKTENI